MHVYTSKVALEDGTTAREAFISVALPQINRTKRALIYVN